MSQNSNGNPFYLKTQPVISCAFNKDSAPYALQMNCFV